MIDRFLMAFAWLVIIVGVVGLIIAMAGLIAHLT